MSKSSIFVTRPALPPLDDLLPHLEQMWETRILTNGGPFHQELEAKLREHLGVEHICLFSNGTIALLTALQALDLSGEVITTPYSFAATPNALTWNRLTPVFVDIDPLSLNLDPSKIEQAITPQTSAIMPVHCYGRPSDVAAIQEIADKHRLRVIYDAAHAFAVEDAGGSILRYGDLSVLSFHATKVFNTFEGGAIVCGNAEMKARIDRLKNFGLVGETDIEEPGLNGKMHEFSAALGLLQIEHIHESIRKRGVIDALYRTELEPVKGINIPKDNLSIKQNYSYFPIMIEDKYPVCRDRLQQKLKDIGILTRRYFFPPVSEFTPYRKLPSATPDNLPVATRTASQVLCLPIFPDLELETVTQICRLIRDISG